MSLEPSLSEEKDHYRLLLRVRAASPGQRFPPSLEQYDALVKRYQETATVADARAIAYTITSLSAAPVMPDYEAARAIENAMNRLVDAPNS